MALQKSSDVVSNRHLLPPAKPAQAGEVMAQRFKLTVAPADLALNSLLGLAVLPENCLPVDLKMHLDDLDSATTLQWTAGILNLAQDGLVTGSELISAATVGQAAGVQGVNALGCIHEPATWLAQSGAPGLATEKIVAMRITTAPTGVAGDIYGTLFYASVDASLRV
jgi:hypothetical protein